jgi:hypothetical protein
MAGPFAHIMIVDQICQIPKNLNSIVTLTKPIRYALRHFNKFCELGAVSPDCPYLRLGDNEAAGWANVMHYWQTADFIRRAISYINDLGLDSTEGQKCIAWLFGYTAHIVTDLTIHPVVNLRVGPYEQNKVEHRRCEMNQDAYIFNKLTSAEIVTAEFLRSCGIINCTDELNKNKLDSAIRKLWCHCLNDVSLDKVKINEGLPVPKKPPEPDGWFLSYSLMMDKFAEEGKRLIYFFRQFADDEGLIYPSSDEVDQTYIYNLKIPGGTRGDYDVVFERAGQQVFKVWDWLGDALVQRNQNLFTLVNGNLDTGLATDNTPIFWEAIA